MSEKCNEIISIDSLSRNLKFEFNPFGHECTANLSAIDRIIVLRHLSPFILPG